MWGAVRGWRAFARAACRSWPTRLPCWCVDVCASHFRRACIREGPHAPTHRSRRVGIWLFFTRQAKGLSDAIREKIAEGALDTWRDGEPCGEQGEAIRQFVTAQARQTAALCLPLPIIIILSVGEHHLCATNGSAGAVGFAVDARGADRAHGA